MYTLWQRHLLAVDNPADSLAMRKRGLSSSTMLQGSNRRPIACTIVSAMYDAPALLLRGKKPRSVWDIRTPRENGCIVYFLTILPMQKTLLSKHRSFGFSKRSRRGFNLAQESASFGATIIKSAAEVDPMYGAGRKSVRGTIEDLREVVMQHTHLIALWYL